MTNSIIINNRYIFFSKKNFNIYNIYNIYNTKYGSM